jgi:hypothetical protein
MFASRPAAHTSNTTPQIKTDKVHGHNLANIISQTRHKIELAQKEYDTMGSTDPTRVTARETIVALQANMTILERKRAATMPSGHHKSDAQSQLSLSVKDVLCTDPATTGYVMTNTELTVDNGFDVTGICDSSTGYSGTVVVTACTISGPYSVSGCTLSETDDLYDTLIAHVVPSIPAFATGTSIFGTKDTTDAALSTAAEATPMTLTSLGGFNTEFITDAAGTVRELISEAAEELLGGEFDELIEKFDEQGDMLSSLKDSLTSNDMVAELIRGITGSDDLTEKAAAFAETTGADIQSAIKTRLQSLVDSSSTETTEAAEITDLITDEMKTAAKELGAEMQTALSGALSKRRRLSTSTASAFAITISMEAQLLECAGYNVKLGVTWDTVALTIIIPLDSEDSEVTFSISSGLTSSLGVDITPEAADTGATCVQPVSESVSLTTMEKSILQSSTHPTSQTSATESLLEHKVRDEFLNDDHQRQDGKRQGQPIEAFKTAPNAQHSDTHESGDSKAARPTTPATRYHDEVSKEVATSPEDTGVPAALTTDLANAKVAAEKAKSAAAQAAASATTSTKDGSATAMPSTLVADVVKAEAAAEKAQAAAARAQAAAAKGDATVAKRAFTEARAAAEIAKSHADAAEAATSSGVKVASAKTPNAQSNAEAIKPKAAMSTATPGQQHEVSKAEAEIVASEGNVGVQMVVENTDAATIIAAKDNAATVDNSRSHSVASHWRRLQDTSGFFTGCICEYGTKDTECVTWSTFEACTACNPGHRLYLPTPCSGTYDECLQKTCTANVCTCAGGTETISGGSGGTLCETTGEEDCSACDEEHGYGISATAGAGSQTCISRTCTCTCPNGTPTVTGASSPAEKCEFIWEDCSACEDGYVPSATFGTGQQTCRKYGYTLLSGFKISEIKENVGVSVGFLWNSDAKYTDAPSDVKSLDSFGVDGQAGWSLGLEFDWMSLVGSTAAWTAASTAAHAFPTGISLAFSSHCADRDEDGNIDAWEWGKGMEDTTDGVMEPVGIFLDFKPFRKIEDKIIELSFGWANDLNLPVVGTLPWEEAETMIGCTDEEHWNVGLGVPGLDTVRENEIWWRVVCDGRPWGPGALWCDTPADQPFPMCNHDLCADNYHKCSNNNAGQSQCWTGDKCECDNGNVIFGPDGHDDEHDGVCSYDGGTRGDDSTKAVQICTAGRRALALSPNTPFPNMPTVLDRPPRARAEARPAVEPSSVGRRQLSASDAVLAMGAGLVIDYLGSGVIKRDFCIGDEADCTAETFTKAIVGTVELGTGSYAGSTKLSVSVDELKLGALVYLGNTTVLGISGTKCVHAHPCFFHIPEGVYGLCVVISRIVCDVVLKVDTAPTFACRRRGSREYR